MDSESSSAQSTSQADNRNVLGQGATQAQGGSSVFQSDNRADNRSSTQIDNSISYALDGDVANRAIDSASSGLTASLGFGTGALTKAFEFAGNSLKSLADGQDRALDSVADSNSMVKDAYADAKGRGAMTDNITIAALALAGLVAFAAVKGKSA